MELNQQMDTVAAAANSTAPVIEQPTVTFDLSSIDTVKDANAGAEIQLYHPTQGTDLGIFIRVVGKDSDLFKKVQREQNQKRVAKLQRTSFRGQIDQDAEAVQLLAGCTQGWSGMILSSKEVPFSQENAIAIYTKYPWIREQVDIAIGDRSLFTKA